MRTDSVLLHSDRPEHQNLQLQFKVQFALTFLLVAMAAAVQTGSVITCCSSSSADDEGPPDDPVFTGPQSDPACECLTFNPVTLLHHEFLLVWPQTHDRFFVQIHRRRAARSDSSEGDSEVSNKKVLDWFWLTNLQVPLDDGSVDSGPCLDSVLRVLMVLNGPISEKIPENVRDHTAAEHCG